MEVIYYGYIIGLVSGISILGAGLWAIGRQAFTSMMAASIAKMSHGRNFSLVIDITKEKTVGVNAGIKSKADGSIKYGEKDSIRPDANDTLIMWGSPAYIAKPGGGVINPTETSSDLGVDQKMLNNVTQSAYETGKLVGAMEQGDIKRYMQVVIALVSVLTIVILYFNLYA
jgi:hypothetical protein